MDFDQMKHKSEQVADMLKSMAHPERLMVLCQLSQQEMSVTELFNASHLSQSAFSQQLKVLRQQQLVRVRKESQHVFYSLADERVSALLTTLHEQFCREE